MCLFGGGGRRPAPCELRRRSIKGSGRGRPEGRSGGRSEWPRDWALRARILTNVSASGADCCDEADFRCLEPASSSMTQIWRRRRPRSAGSTKGTETWRNNRHWRSAEKPTPHRLRPVAACAAAVPRVAATLCVAAVQCGHSMRRSHPTRRECAALSFAGSRLLVHPRAAPSCAARLRARRRRLHVCCSRMLSHLARRLCISWHGHRRPRKGWTRGVNSAATTGFSDPCARRKSSEQILCCGGLGKPF